MIDIDRQTQLRLKYNPEDSDLRRMQLRMLDLLAFIDKICKKYGLTYWLSSGTLLGAARHGGFIPWDDDVDVCMPIKDARKLKKIMGNKIFDGHIILQNHKTDWNYLQCGWMTIRDIKTEYIQNSYIHNALKYKGLQVDIFEVESGLTYLLKSIPNQWNKYLIYKPAQNCGGSKIMRTFANINSRILNMVINPTLRLFKRGNLIYDYALGNPFRMRQDKNLIFPLRKISFENIMFNCPNDISRYLANVYGEWETIPSEDKIRTHNVSFKNIE